MFHLKRNNYELAFVAPSTSQISLDFIWIKWIYACAFLFPFLYVLRIYEKERRDMQAFITS